MIHYCQKSSTNYYVISFFSHLSFCTLLYDAGTETTNSISPSLDGFHLGPIKKKKAGKEGRRKGAGIVPSYFVSCFCQQWSFTEELIGGVTGSILFCYFPNCPSCASWKPAEPSEFVFWKWFGDYWYWT